MNTNNRRPVDSKDNEKILSKWISHQIENYKKNVEIMSNIKIRKTWKEFVSDMRYRKYFRSVEEVWFDNLKGVKKYINHNNKRPSSKSKNEEERRLGCWILRQKTYYKNNEKMLSHEKIRKILEEFVNNANYCEYFKSDKDLWMDNLKEVNLLRYRTLGH